jgi:hypothetical protein
MTLRTVLMSTISTMTPSRVITKKKGNNDCNAAATTLPNKIHRNLPHSQL